MNALAWIMLAGHLWFPRTYVHVHPFIPLMPKMTPNVSDIAAVAKACEEAGADAIAATNSVQALIGVDVDPHGRSIVSAVVG